MGIRFFLRSPVIRRAAGECSVPICGVIDLELGHLAGWIIGSALLASGALLFGYSLGFKAGARRSSLAKDLRTAAQEQRIARLEKAVGEPSPKAVRFRSDVQRPPKPWIESLRKL